MLWIIGMTICTPRADRRLMIFSWIFIIYLLKVWWAIIVQLFIHLVVLYRWMSGSHDETIEVNDNHLRGRLQFGRADAARTIIRRRTGRLKRCRGHYRNVTVQSHRPSWPVTMDQRRLRPGHQQEPVVPRLPEIRDDWYRRKW